MRPDLPLRLVVATILASMLAGCLDAKVEIAVTGPDSGTTVVTQTMAADVYAMLQMNAERAQEQSDNPGATAHTGFCAEGELTETADGGATCTASAEGDFAALMRASGQVIRFTSEDDGHVRVEIALADVRIAIGVGQADAEGQEMLDAFFSGHMLTVAIAGEEIVDSNLDPGKDGRGLEAAIPLLDIINGTGDWPDVLYALVAP